MNAIQMIWVVLGIELDQFGKSADAATLLRGRGDIEEGLLKHSESSNLEWKGRTSEIGLGSSEI